MFDFDQRVLISWFYGLHLVCFHFLSSITQKIWPLSTGASNLDSHTSKFKGIEASTLVFPIGIDLDHHELVFDYGRVRLFSEELRIAVSKFFFDP